MPINLTLIIKKIGLCVVLLYFVSTYLSYINPAYVNFVSYSLYILAVIGLIHILVSFNKIEINKYIKLYSLFSIIVFYFAVFPYLGSSYANVVLDSFYEIIRTLVLLYCCSLFIRDINDIKKVLFAISISSTIMIFFTAKNFDIDSGIRFGNEIAGNANIIAPLFMFSAFSTIYFLCNTSSKVTKLVMLFFYIIQLYALILTGTKKTFLISFFFLWIYYIISRKNNYLLMMVFLFLGIELFIYIVLNIPFVYNLIGYRFESMLSFFTGSGISDASTLERASMVEDAINIGMSNPVFGIGLNMFSIIANYSTYSHNNYVELFCTTGILSALFYYSIYIYAIISLFKQQVDNEEKSFFVLVIFSLLIYELGAVTYNLPFVQIFVMLTYIYIQHSKKKYKFA